MISERNVLAEVSMDIRISGLLQERMIKREEDSCALDCWYVSRV